MAKEKPVAQALFDSMQEAKRHLVAKKNQISVMKAAQESLEKDVAAIREFCEAVEGLSQSWRQSYPGKDRRYWLVLSRYEIKNHPRRGPKALLDIIGYDGFHARELVDDPPAAGKSKTSNPLADLSSAAPCTCPACGHSALVILSREQTFDSPDGDLWETFIFTLCPECAKLTHLAYRGDTY